MEFLLVTQSGSLGKSGFFQSVTHTGGSLGESVCLSVTHNVSNHVLAYTTYSRFNRTSMRCLMFSKSSDS